MKKLPGVDHLLEQTKADPFFEDVPRSVLVNAVRAVIDLLRSDILSATPDIEKDLSDTVILEKIRARVQTELSLNLIPLINATGVVVHTNLGRSLLAPEAIENIALVAGSYSNLEFDLELGKRGSRYSAVEDILCELTRAEAAMVVNNNAGAVLLALETLSKGKTAIVSRGELVEIGGSFRIPDVMARSGAILKEVGTTNRTHPRDYEGAIDADTGLLLKVHTSNYSVLGFTASVSLKDLVAIGRKYQLPVMEDLGSGTFTDFSKYGLKKEPTVQESVSAGADIITFSGDKLLGGPQAGIIVGRKDLIDNIRKNPITRALRIDKLTLAALESTLRLYRDPEKAVRRIPTLRMLTMPFEEIEKKAEMLYDLLKTLNDSRISVKLLTLSSRVGGGALPIQELPSRCLSVTIQGMSANRIEWGMRNHKPPIIGRIEEDAFIMDMRTVQDDDIDVMMSAFHKINSD
ncbi:MAG: L-seryl-tRNA(Sec) selenium transferase [Desulfobacteraceae bacterium IS3]|nr:MAG: L-seryl-tRNA(Sec) selenium transferase [Desulfobacteraceae bacterium IS3]